LEKNPLLPLWIVEREGLSPISLVGHFVASEGLLVGGRILRGLGAVELAACNLTHEAFGRDCLMVYTDDDVPFAAIIKGAYLMEGGQALQSSEVVRSVTFDVD
jgi:hypothetical protein